ncbi:MAG TPA: cation transporter dimerization domain-containing protein, partial [Polyangia bacterium]|nr:cation transporter dimerization domain-containing protein [Polyangia bacterium]
RNRDFLVGREAAPPVRARLNELIARQDGVARVGELLVTYVGPRRLWVVARLDVDHRLDVLSLDRLLSRVENSVHTEIPAVVRVDLTPHAI